MHLIKICQVEGTSKTRVALAHQVSVSERSRLVNDTVSHTWVITERV